MLSCVLPVPTGPVVLDHAVRSASDARTDITAAFIAALMSAEFTGVGGISAITVLDCHTEFGYVDQSGLRKKAWQRAG